MDTRNLEKAVEIFGALLNGEEINREAGKNTALYDAYNTSSEVGDILDVLLKKLNLKLYEHNYGLFLTAGDHNRVFGFTNEELKRAMGLRLNKELYLCYFIIYNIILYFYKDSASYTYAEYIRIAEAADGIGANLSRIMDGLKVFARNELEENSFRTLALLWDELPAVINEDTGEIRAGRGSRAGYVKLVFNFLIAQGMFAEVEERYYPTERFHAIVRNYYEEERGRLYEILKEIDGAVSEASAENSSINTENSAINAERKEDNGHAAD